MPEAAVYEYGDTRASEDDVSDPRHCREGALVDSVPIALSMEFRTKRDLAGGVANSLQTHPPTHDV